MEVREIKVRYSRNTMRLGTRKTLHTSTDVEALIRPFVADATNETFFAVYLDARHRPIGYVRKDGTVGSVNVRTADLLGTAMLCAAPSMIIAHNHPSGEVSPSAEDRQLTARLGEVCALLGVTLLDHVILDGQGAFFSFADQQLL